MPGFATSLDFSAFEGAVQSLEGALIPPPANERERDGAIQRFEYTFELSWKFGKRVLEQSGIQSPTPRSVIRDLAQAGWISDARLWMKFLEARNATSLTYSAKTAEEVFQATQIFLTECKVLLERLKKEALS